MVFNLSFANSQAQLTLDSDIFTKLTLSYSLGEQHALCGPMLAAQTSLSDDT